MKRCIMCGASTVDDPYLCPQCSNPYGYDKTKLTLVAKNEMIPVCLKCNCLIIKSENICKCERSNDELSTQ